MGGLYDAATLRALVLSTMAGRYLTGEQTFSKTQADPTAMEVRGLARAGRDSNFPPAKTLQTPRLPPDFGHPNLTVITKN